MNEKSLGVYVYEKKVFYYLEAGKVHMTNTVERIKRTLFQRNIIAANISGSYSAPTYEIMSVAQAKLKEYQMEPIYLSKNIQESVEKKPEAQSKSWS